MLPAILRKDIRLSTLSALTTREMTDLRAVIGGLQILDIDHVHPSYLPWLAWWFRVDIWDEAWTLTRKRQVVKNALLLYRYKGTVWAVERALTNVGYQVDVLPWHQQTPTGIKGTFTAHVKSSQSVDATDYERIFALIEANKQASQTWVANIERDAEATLSTVITSRGLDTVIADNRDYPVAGVNGVAVIGRSITHNIIKEL